MNLDTYQMKIIYDPNALEVVGAEGGAGVSNGKIGDTVIPIDMWRFSPLGVPGTVFFLGNLPGVSGVSGDGCLAHINFRVKDGFSGRTEIKFEEGKLFDNSLPVKQIEIEEWVDGYVDIVKGETAVISIVTPTEVKAGETFVVDVIIEKKLIRR